MGSAPSKQESMPTNFDESTNDSASPPQKETKLNADPAPKPQNPLSPNAKADISTTVETSKQSTEVDLSYPALSTKVTDVMDALNKIEDFGEGETFTLLNEIIKIYYMTSIKQLDDLQKLCSLMISKGLLELFVRIWDFCHQNTEEFYAQTEGKKFSNLNRAKVIFWNYTDKCEELAKACYKNGDVIERLMREFTIPQLDVPSLKQPRIRHTIKATLGILHNLVRHESRNRNHIRKDSGIEKILAYEKSTYLIIKAKIFIVLAFCINEDENEKIMTGRGVVTFIMELLSSALESPNHIGKIYAFSAQETVEALNKLASNDENKKTIVESGVLPRLVKLLDPETCSSAERLVAVNCIWSLAFHPENKDKIIEEQGLIEGVEKLRSEFKSDLSINKACSSTMFVLGLEQAAEEISDAEKSDKKHIMLSYNWEVQVVMLELRNLLQESGYKIWIDVDKMQASILSAMADAVENAALIIIAMTDNYKNSNSCRTEAEYAYKREVPILPLRLQNGYEADGWLGAMLGTKLFVDITSGALDTKFDEIVKQIDGLITVSKSERRVVPFVASGNLEAVNRPMPNELNRMTSVDGAVSMARAVIPCRNWTTDEVKDWFRGTGIKENPALKDCDGIVLSQLCKLLLRSPDSYYLVLRQEMQFSFKDMLKFTDALEVLISS